MRSGDAIEQIIAIIKTMSYKSESFVKILFLSAHPTLLQKRFHETRRNHPLAENIDLSKAIELEKKMLFPFLELADTVVQTDQLSAQQLRQLVRKSFIKDSPQQIVVNLMSFGFKYGVPSECNFVYDVRSLPNPYFEPMLRSFDGTNKCIQDYLFSKEVVHEYWQHLTDFFSYTIGQAYQEGRFFMTIAIGCTGGRHRSVAFVQKLSELKLDNVLFNIKHRDIQFAANVEHLSAKQSC